MGEKAQQAYEAINEILGCLKPAEININKACNIINELGISNISFKSHEDFYDELEEASNKFAEYMTMLCVSKSLIWLKHLYSSTCLKEFPYVKTMMKR